VFRNSSQSCRIYPLVGGLGYGKIRISVVFRSVTCKLPRELIGWDVGTLTVEPTIRSENLPEEICGASRITPTTNIQGKGKLNRDDTEKGVWSGDNEIKLPIKQRYSSHLMLSFRKNKTGADTTIAFAVLWLREIPDDEDKEVELAVWDNDGSNIKRAEQNYDESYGEQLGTIKVKLRYWSGLIGFKRKVAKRDNHMMDVMAILQCASEGKELRDDVTSDYSDESNDDSSDEEEKKKLSEDGNRNMIDDIKEYKQNHKELHRHHRGLMQWKGIRGLNWVKDEVKGSAGNTFQRITGRDTHDHKKMNVETEV